MADPPLEKLDPIKLATEWDPFANCIWDIEVPVTAFEIGLLVDTKDTLRPGRTMNDCSRMDHMRRIAWFVTHGWSDAIEVDVGIPSLGFPIGWPILDGNHRYIASLCRLDKHILASCSGEIKVIRALRAKRTRANK